MLNLLYIGETEDPKKCLHTTCSTKVTNGETEGLK